MNLRTRIKELIQVFVNVNGREPTRVHLSPSDEVEIMTLSQDELGKEPYRIVMTAGPRHLERLLGLGVVFDSDQTFVD